MAAKRTTNSNALYLIHGMCENNRLAWIRAPVDACILFIVSPPLPITRPTWKVQLPLWKLCRNISIRDNRHYMVYTLLLGIFITNCSAPDGCPATLREIVLEPPESACPIACRLLTQGTHHIEYWRDLLCIGFKNFHHRGLLRKCN